MFRLPGFDSQDDWNVDSSSDNELSENKDDTIDSIDLQEIEDSLLRVHALPILFKRGYILQEGFSKGIKHYLLCLQIHKFTSKHN